jgi:hypothetical protein
MSIPTGLQHALARAAQDEQFRTDLLTRRAEAARESGIRLSESEASILDLVDAAMLEQMIGGITEVPLPEPLDREEAIPLCLGIRPDFPIAPQGIRPDIPESASKVRGHSSCMPWAVGGLVLAAGGVGLGLLTVTAGVRPDIPLPPVAAPVESDASSAAPPDAGPDGSPDAEDDGPWENQGAPPPDQER